MSSLARRMQRKILRSRSDYEAKPQPTIIHKDGGYTTLRPTKGWLRVAGARLAAQVRMAALLDHVLPRRERKPKNVYQYQKRNAPAPAPSTITRQQRRHDARKKSLVRRLEDAIRRVPSC